MSPSGDGWFGRPILRPAKEPPLPQIQHPAGHPPRRNLSRTAAPVSLSRLAYLMMGVALILTPVIILLFAAGDGVHHTGKDRLAVVCVIAQCLLVGAALRGYDRTAISDRVGAV